MKLRGMYAAVALAVVAASATACAPSSTAPATSTSPTSNVQTDAAKMGNVSVKLLDSFTDNTAPIGKFMQQSIAAFEAKYPNIKIVRQSQNSNDINSTLRLRLADPATPDIVPANQGWQQVGAYSASGLLLNLDAYSSAYGWDKSLPATILSQSKASTDGKSIGQGSLFGVPINQGAFITVFYNRAQLQQLGLQVPKSFADFESALGSAKSAGMVPIQFGAQDGWPVAAPMEAILAAAGKPDKISTFVYGTAPVTAADTGLTESNDVFERWVKAGYIAPNFAGVDSSTASQSFVDGKGLFYFWYSGFLPFKDQAQGDQFGQFLLPRVDGGSLAAVGSATQNFSIAAKSKQPDAAAAFLNFLASPDAGQIAMNNQIIPMFGTFQPTTSSPLLNDGLQELNDVTAANGYLPYLDWATPTLLDTITREMQTFLAGKSTSAAVTDAVNADYQKFHDSKTS